MEDIEKYLPEEGLNDEVKIFQELMEEYGCEKICEDMAYFFYGTDSSQSLEVYIKDFLERLWETAEEILSDSTEYHPYD